MPETKALAYKVKVNEFEFTITQDELAAVDLIQKSASHFHLLHNHQSLSAHVIDFDASAKEQTVVVEGERFEVSIEDELDQKLDQMGFSSVTNKQVKEIKAPMPGLVLEVNIAEGQTVTEGQKLLILVAMKMENAITIPADAIIKRIAVKPGDAVDKGQLLIELE